MASTKGMIGPAPTTSAPAADPQPPGGVNRYIMRQRIFALGQDFYINDAAGQPVFKIDGKVRLVKEALKLRDMQGNLLYKLKDFFDCRVTTLVHYSLLVRVKKYIVHSRIQIPEETS